MKHTLALLLMSTALLTACYDTEFDTGGFAVPSLITFEGGFETNDNPLLRNKLTYTAIDDVIITVNATNVDALQATAVGESGTTDLGMVAISNEQGTLNTSWSELEGVDHIAFTGAPDSDQPYTKSLEIIQTSPFTLNYQVDGVAFTTPSEVYNDSTFTVYYELATANTPIQSVEFLQRVGSTGEYVSLNTKTVNATTEAPQSFVVDIPSEQTLALDSTFSVKAIVTGSNGLTYEQNIAVTNLAIDLPSRGQLALRTDNDGAFSFAALDTGSFTDAQADIRLVTNESDGTLTLEADPASNTTFVLSNDFTIKEATYQSVRDAFAQGTAITTINDLANIPTKTVILVKIGSQSGASQYAALQLNSLTRTLKGGEIVVDYRARI